MCLPITDTWTLSTWWPGPLRCKARCAKPSWHSPGIERWWRWPGRDWATSEPPTGECPGHCSSRSLVSHQRGAACPVPVCSCPTPNSPDTHCRQLGICRSSSEARKGVLVACQLLSAHQTQTCTLVSHTDRIVFCIGKISHRDLFFLKSSSHPWLGSGISHHYHYSCELFSKFFGACLTWFFPIKSY